MQSDNERIERRYQRRTVWLFVEESLPARPLHARQQRHPPTAAPDVLHQALRTWQLPDIWLRTVGMD